MSWDEIAVLVAIKGYKPLFNLQTGRIIVEEGGFNKWDYNGKGQSYLTESAPIEKVEEILNNLMMHQPK
jgi:hypothetical protein